MYSHYTNVERREYAYSEEVQDRMPRYEFSNLQLGIVWNIYSDNNLPNLLKLMFEIYKFTLLHFEVWEGSSRMDVQHQQSEFLLSQQPEVLESWFFFCFIS
jgi:hypothetical protein